MQDRNEINRELISLELLTDIRTAHPTKMLSRLVQEFLALTLLSNRDTAKVLKSYGTALGLSKHLPKSVGDQWMLRRAHGKGVAEEISGSTERKRLRQSILRMRGAAYQAIEKRLGLIPRQIEHVAFRLIPVQITKPQSRGKEHEQVLLAAYHLEHCWLHITTADPCAGYAKGTDGESRIFSAMLTRKQWESFADEIRSRQVANGSDPGTPIILHAPKGSGLSDVMGEKGNFFVVEDMPSVRLKGAVLRIRYRFKHSVTRPLQQISLAGLLREPTIDERLRDADMTTLPDLAQLSHRQKDVLIKTLWSALATLRQREAKETDSQGETGCHH